MSSGLFLFKRLTSPSGLLSEEMPGSGVGGCCEQTGVQGTRGGGWGFGVGRAAAFIWRQNGLKMAKGNSAWKSKFSTGVQNLPPWGCTCYGSTAQGTPAPPGLAKKPGLCWFDQPAGWEKNGGEPQSTAKINWDGSGKPVNLKKKGYLQKKETSKKPLKRDANA